MNIVSHQENTEGLWLIAMDGGPNDGQEFRSVKAEMDDGSTRPLWISNTHEGYYKLVFVPWNFEHPKILPNGI